MNLFTFVLLATSMFAQAEELPPFIKQYSKTATFYYKSPDADLCSKMFQELVKKENLEHPWFVKRSEVLILIGSQFGDMALGNPKLVREYEATFTSAPLLGRRAIVRALVNCGDKESIKAVDKWLKDKQFAEVQSELETLKKTLEDPDRKHFRDLPAKTPKDLDLLWANFCVTGEYAPVSRILDVFDLPDDNTKETLILKRVAKWSMGSNLQQHPKLVELVMKNAKDRPMGSKKAIDELIIKFPAEPKK